MYLSQLHLQGFRTAADTKISFQPGVTVLLGENNAGKSNVMDSLRHLTQPLDPRERGLYPSRDDLHRDGCAEGKHGGGCRTSIDLVARYFSSNPADLHLYASAFADDPEKPYPDGQPLPSAPGDTPKAIRYHLNITPPATALGTAKRSWTAGTGNTADRDPEPTARDRIRHVYLPPLRDARRELGSAGGARIQHILERLLKEDADRDKFLTEVGGAFDRLRTEQKPLQAAAEAVQSRLTLLTEGAHPQATDLGFADATLSSIARNLRFLMAQVGLDPRDLAESGLGYANLMFMATVLTQLEKAAEADLTLLLVEEPEAHLHPQLQAILLDHLAEEARKSQLREADAKGWLGRIQVIVTTHSPHVATAVDPRNVVVLQRRVVAAPVPTKAQGDAIGTAEGPVQQAEEVGTSSTAELPPPPRISYRTTAVSVGRLDLPEADRNKIGNYLNATRNVMLFGQRVLLVEGIAESVVLPAFARTAFAEAPARLQRFHGTALIPIDGVDFLPYLRLLLAADPDTGRRIARRVAIVTDGDAGRDRREKVAARRISDIKQLIMDTGSVGAASLFRNEFTLEAELLRAGGVNRDLLLQAWMRQRPEAWQMDWKTIGAGSPDDQARAMSNLLDSKKLRKGDLAQDFLSGTTQPFTSTSFTVPEYLTDALRWVTEELPDDHA